MPILIYLNSITLKKQPAEETLSFLRRLNYFARIQFKQSNDT